MPFELFLKFSKEMEGLRVMFLRGVFLCLYSLDFSTYCAFAFMDSADILFACLLSASYFVCVLAMLIYLFVV